MKILILGVAGMLGQILFEQFMKDDTIDVYGTARSMRPLQGWMRDEDWHRVIPDVDADKPGGIESTVASVKPDMVINCIGIIKQLPIANDPIPSISVN
ncbi:MAG: NAD-dependent epimerase/dehydratase family protein, partial [Anaerolineaceae bacterium]